MFKAKTNVGMLVECIEAITGVADNGVVNITKDGWDIRVVNPANVAMVSLKLQNTSFDGFEFESPPVIKVGIDFANLLGMLKLWEQSEVELELNEKDLFIKSDIFDYSVSLIKMSSLRRVPNVPDLTFSVQVNVEARQFVRAIRAMERVSVSSYVTLGVKGKELYMEEKEGRDKLRSVFWSILKKEPGNFRSQFSLEYLSAMCVGISHAKHLTLSFNNDYPLQINFDVAHGKGEVSYLLAPRIPPDDRTTHVKNVGSD